MVTVETKGVNGDGHAHSGGDPFDCPLFRMLPTPLQEQSRDRPHLWDYLHQLNVEEIGVPDFLPTLTSEHKDIERPNLVYPAGTGGIFIHIMPDENDARDFYIAIEPNRSANLSELLEQVDSKLVDYVDALQDADDTEKRAKVLVELVNEICEVSGGKGSGSGLRGLFKKRSGGKVRVNPIELEGIRYMIVRDKLGMGPIEPMIQDPHIEDISCSGVGNVFVEHRIFGSLKANVSFVSIEELDRFVIRISEKIGRPVTFRDPIVDAVLPDGSRVNIVFGGGRLQAWQQLYHPEVHR